MVTRITILFSLAALLAVSLANAAETTPPKATFVSTVLPAPAPPVVTENMPAVCVCSSYCYKRPPCVQCPPPGNRYACYDKKPAPCVQCPPCGNYYAPYCCKPAPQICLPCIPSCPGPPCRRPCDD